ncbi:hypothetical protein BG004_002032 [Podila humilis]|nr:hypothetical protein BG004_002032 [Podila humilis]
MSIAIQQRKKASTHEKREKARSKARDRANEAIAVLENRLQSKTRIRKHYIAAANKAPKSAFYWSLEDRRSFVDYKVNLGYEITLCDTAADVKIAADCSHHDAVVTGDSDLIIYKNVPSVWRPMRGFKSRMYWLYERNAVLETLDIRSNQLMALAITSGCGYTGNIPTLGFKTNRKLIKNMEDGSENSNIPFGGPIQASVYVQNFGSLTALFAPCSYSVDVISIIKNHHVLTEVIYKVQKDTANDWTLESFANAFKVFVSMRQDRDATTTSGTHLR